PRRTLFPYTTLFRSRDSEAKAGVAVKRISVPSVAAALIAALVVTACAPELPAPSPTEAPKRSYPTQRGRVSLYGADFAGKTTARSEEHTSELQSLRH